MILKFRNIHSYWIKIFSGISIILFNIIIYTLIDLIYFNNQIYLANYIDKIKIYGIAISIIVYVILVLLFYKKTQNRTFVDFILIAVPYFILVLFSTIYSKNIPRLIDFVFISTGLIIVYKIGSLNNARKQHYILLSSFVLLTLLSYPLIYENISYNYKQNITENIPINGKYNLAIYDTNGNTLKLSDFKSKTVCIDMWSSSCGGCIRTMPDFESLVNYYKKDTSIKFISLFCPIKEHETFEWFKEYLKRKEFNYQIPYYYIQLSDFQKLGIYRFPEFWLLNSDNSIVYRGTVTYEKTIYNNIYYKLDNINENF